MCGKMTDIKVEMNIETKTYLRMKLDKYQKHFVFRAKFDESLCLY